MVTKGISTKEVEVRHGVGIITLWLTHLAAIFGKNSACSHYVSETYTIEKKSGNGMHIVKPCSGLGNIFGNEISREMFFEFFFTLKWIMILSKWHRARFDPAIYYFWNSFEWLAIFGNQFYFIYVGAMQVQFEVFIVRQDWRIKSDYFPILHEYRKRFRSLLIETFSYSYK